ncbi:hypothetical protein C8Q80DRAFT_431948 [Daedaleopsis nitida]|nr:hypothetical protein C8Q80DRAFT_431948 [Daedaleopsis nitida]
MAPAFVWVPCLLARAHCTTSDYKTQSLTSEAIDRSTDPFMSPATQLPRQHFEAALDAHVGIHPINSGERTAENLRTEAVEVVREPHWTPCLLVANVHLGSVHVDFDEQLLQRKGAVGERHEAMRAGREGRTTRQGSTAYPEQSTRRRGGGGTAVRTRLCHVFVEHGEYPRVGEELLEPAQLENANLSMRSNAPLCATWV